LITCSQSGFYTVETEIGTLSCRLRGRLKHGPRQEDIVAVGDWVKVTPMPKGKGMIEVVEARQRMLSRMAPMARGLYQQIILANPDQVVLVFACALPEPHLGMLDRFLVIAEKQEIPAVIAANKIDLVGQIEAERLFGHYRTLGYRLIYTSARSNIGVTELRDCLSNKISALLGPSGVGKTSLLNAMQPGLGLTVRQVSAATAKGRHTTVVRQMFRLEGGGYIVDTPGLKALALWDIQPEELDAYFPELRGLVSQCQFNDCTHIQEPGCAVRLAVASGEVARPRYESYVRIRSGQEE
jgi:ribosome biogenesis GTPase